MGAAVLVLFVLLVLLQSSNLWKNLTIETSSDLVLLYALSSLNFIAFIIFGFIFLRSIFKLMRERRTLELGSQIKTRLLLYFFAVSLMPIIAMAVFSYLFMNRALDRWFTEIPANVLQETRKLEQRTITNRTVKLNETAKMLATTLETGMPSSDELRRVAEAGGLSYIEIETAKKVPLSFFAKKIPADQKAELDAILLEARAEAPDASILRDGRGFDVAVAPMLGGRTLIVVPDPFSEESISQIVDNSMVEFERLKEKQVTIRLVGLLTLGVLTFLLIFASMWIAFYIARGLTAPIKALALGADEIAKGNLGHRVEVLAEDELALLVAAFNGMSARLEKNSADLSEGRKYIETVLETLPTGVISFDAENRVGTINRAAINILRLNDDNLSRVELTSLLNDENGAILERLINRAKRIGNASEQTVLRPDQPDGVSEPETGLTVALTASALPDENGTVLVIEDLSELIAAQRASAWQEVARRMAHEIKNPLTPIQLSAERIAKRFASSLYIENGGGQRVKDLGPIGEVVEESTSTILREVSSLKSMVDEFSRFARLPDAKLAIGNLNEIVQQAVASYEGRFPDIAIDCELGNDIPDTLIDAEQLKRVFVNLIENATESFESASENKRIAVKTRHDIARDLLVAEVSDNGKGISKADLQKLFQPYFSTKGRGTGLGLAIVRRIVSEHYGKINAVANQRQGAKFIIELPVGG